MKYSRRDRTEGRDLLQGRISRSRDGKQPSEIHHKEYGAHTTQNCMIVADRLQTLGKANTSLSILRFIGEPAADVPREKIAFSFDFEAPISSG